MLNLKKSLTNHFINLSEFRQKKDTPGKQKCFGILYEPKNPLSTYQNKNQKKNRSWKL